MIQRNIPTSLNRTAGIVGICLLYIGAIFNYFYLSPWSNPLPETETPKVLNIELGGLNKSELTRNEISQNVLNVLKNLHSAFLEIKDLPLSDSKIAKYLRDHILVRPSTLPYKLTNISKEYPSSYTKILERIFGAKKDGFFIECGANDGELLSNTLDLEKKGWKGLLVEAQPQLGELLRTKNRKAWFANVCLSPFKNISELEFAVHRQIDKSWMTGLGKLVLPDTKRMDDHRLVGLVPCFPLDTIMSAINVKHVDYLALDVEGVELKILKTLPFDETLVIDIIQVESNLLPEGEKALKRFLDKKGYDFMLKKGIDTIFRRRNV